MITLRKAKDRGHTRIGWLDSHHTFSFGEYYDPAHLGYRSLRVINDDRVSPAAGFGTHAHQDMEIITYVLEGELEHKDSLGSGSVIRPGEVQRMSAGTGIRHSEYNPSATAPVHFLQIWILPERPRLDPGYEQKEYPPEELQGRWRLIGAHDGRDGAVTVHQDVDIYAARLEAGDTIQQTLRAGRHAWLHVARGNVVVNGNKLEAGDAVGVSDETAIEVSASAAAEVLLFDLN